jgi:hypothetical protein
MRPFLRQVMRALYKLENFMPGSINNLTVSEIEIVKQCLEAAYVGTFFPEWEFEILFGIEREVLNQMLKVWPDIDESDSKVIRSINNTLNNLIGYPHNKEKEWDIYISVSPDKVSNIFSKWRGNIVPNNKHDFQACKRLSLASDDEVIECLVELLEWLQDINWPVTPYVIERIYKLDSALIEPIREILNSTDGVWKHIIISQLIGKTSKKTRLELKGEILRLIKNPTKNDINEEVNMVAKEVLHKAYENV